MLEHVHRWERKPERQRGEVYKDYQKRLARLDEIIKYFTDREMRCFLAWTRDKKETRWSSPEAKFFCGAGRRTSRNAKCSFIQSPSRA